MKAYLLGGKPIHYPFLSGLMRYDCMTCDAPCCRGNGLGIGRSKELVTLQSVQKNLPLFATPGFSGTAMMSLSAPKEGCWFLDKKARCRLETVVGRDAKPAGCRLFPFHRLRQMGNAVTVMPDFLCPIELGDEIQADGPYSHDELTLEMHKTQLSARGHAPLPPPSDMAWPKALRIEQRLVRKSEKHLNDKSYVPFAQRQAGVFARVAGFDAHFDSLETLDRDLRAFLEVKAPPRPESVREMVALTGTLRLMTSGLPRQAMPGLMLALSVFVDAYDGMRGTKRSLRTIVSLFEQRLPLLFVLGHLGEAPMLKPNTDPARLVASLPAVRAPLLSVLEAVVENRQHKKPRSMLQIFQDQKNTFRPPLSFNAVAMLYGLGKILLTHGTFRYRKRRP